MNKQIFSWIILWLTALNLSAQNTLSDMKLYITIDNNHVLEATLADNSSAKALIDRLQEGPITYTSSPYGGFESVGDIGVSLPTNDTHINTQAGDIILYQGHNICLYYAHNTWTFTRLGRIANASADQLRQWLSQGDIQVTLSLTHPTGITAPKSTFEASKAVFTLDGKQMKGVPQGRIYIENGVKKTK